MKAIIMAGGEGTRLRPVTENCPKPMVKILNRPALYHIISLLKRNGIYDICITLKYMPEKITSYFGDGSDFGVRISYSIENEPMGTAGSVKKCAQFINGEDFLVISGDCVCSFDLRRAISSHQKSDAIATIVLTSCSDPTPYGLVLCDRQGKIVRFLEKPSWDGVLTDCINTGIYILSSEILNYIPDAVAYDFGADLFPEMLSCGKHMRGYTADGYWCDIGSVSALLDCTFKTMSGQTGIIPEGRETEKGVYCGEAVPASIKITAPCYIEDGVKFNGGAEIGPNACILRGSVIGGGSKMKNCICDGAEIDGAKIDGGIICRGTKIGAGAHLYENCAVGENCTVSEGAEIMEGVAVSGGVKIGKNAAVYRAVQSGSKKNIAFSRNSVITGDFYTELTGEDLYEIGGALSEFGEIALASDSSDFSRLAAEIVACGIRSCGADAAVLDTNIKPCALHTASSLGYRVCLFIEGGEHLKLCFFDEYASPIPREMQRRIEKLIKESKSAPKTVGARRNIGGCREVYLKNLKKAYPASERKMSVSVSGRDEICDMLRSFLDTLGFETVSAQMGVCCFSTDEGGKLTAEDENGRKIDPYHMTAIAALAAIAQGQRRIPVSDDMPDAVASLARSCGAQTVSPKDGEYSALFYECEYLYDPIFAAAHIASFMAEEGVTLAEMYDRIPKFDIYEREFASKYGRAETMRRLSEKFGFEAAEEFSAGLKITRDGCAAVIYPSERERTMVIVADGSDRACARDLARYIEETAKNL